MSEKITGIITLTPKLQASIKQDICLRGSLNYSSYEIYNVDKYKGEYNVTPKLFQQQELKTKDKLLEKNIIIKEVPYYETSNAQGITVFIGSEV